MDELFGYIRELIDIPSVSGEEEEVSRFLERDLRERGFQVELQEVESDRHNVHATSGPEPLLYFCTHIDTVPPFYPSTEDEETIFGRGSCDAKGILAAMVTAAERLRQSGVREIGLLFVVGEEVDSAGALAANRLGSDARFVIVGEPTESRLASGHKGGFKFVLRARGKAAHSAYPFLGDSAIDRLLDVLARIREADWGASELLGEATVNVGRIEGGLAANVIAPEAEAVVFVRVATTVAEVRARLDGIVGDDPALSYELIAGSDAVVCETVPGFEVAPVSFGTDIPSLGNFGKPLLIGPGSIHDAHTSAEKLDKKEVVEAVEYYQKLARLLLERIR